MDIARILEELERPQEALDVVQKVLASGKVKRGAESDVHELAADLLYQLARTDDAKREYEESDAHPQSDGDERRIDLKEHGLFTDDETIRSLADRYLFDADDRTAMLYYALRWTQEDPADPIARYLVGFQLWQNHQEGRRAAVARRTAGHAPDACARRSADARARLQSLPHRCS
jgi:predicted negative regulator of RcsB-dependent stress response